MACKTSWPFIEPCLAALAVQADEAGAEIIVADGRGDALPERLPEAYADVVHLVEAGAGSFRLRSLGVARARGAVVAITEDHCIPRADWCRQILRAHADHPAAAAVGGAVENGADERLVDRACFFIANGPFMLPLPNGESPRISLQANVSYKREAIEANDSRLGLMEMLFNEELRRRDRTLVADDRIVVDHVQSLSVPTFCALHFHNGRCIAGFRLERIGWLERLARLGGCAVLPAYLSWRTLRIVLGKGRGVGRTLAAAPFVVMLTCCHAVGELVGYCTGPGTSPSYPNIG